MKKNTSSIGTIVIGTTFIVLGLLFLATLLDLVEFDTLYRTLVPILLMAGGIGAFSSSDPKSRKTGLGLGLFTVGAIGFVIRFNMVSTEHVSAILGVILLVSGVILLTVFAERLSTKKSEEESSPLDK